MIEFHYGAWKHDGIRCAWEGQTTTLADTWYHRSNEEEVTMNRHSVPNAVNAYLATPKDGGSNPRFYDFDDGTIRLVKWHPSSHGHKACYNELVASRLAQLIDAPMLRGGVVFVPDDIIPDDHRAFASEGFHFGVTKMRGENFVPTQHYDNILNATELPFALVFLHWLRIGDQDNHNQFLERVVSEDEWNLKEIGQRFRIVDAGFMYGTPKWNGPDLPATPPAFHGPKHLIDHVADEDIQTALGILGKVSDEAIRACFDVVPDDWAISTEERNIAAEHAILSKNRLAAMKAAELRSA